MRVCAARVSDPQRLQRRPPQSPAVLRALRLLAAPGDSQLNALYDRLLEIAKDRGLQARMARLRARALPPSPSPRPRAESPFLFSISFSRPLTLSEPGLTPNRGRRHRQSALWHARCGRRPTTW